MSMVNFKHLAVMALLLVGLTLSGCVGESPQEQPADDQSVDEQIADEAAQESLNADEILAEEDVGLTDAEIADLEAEMDELAALLEDIESVENISIEEL